MGCNQSHSNTVVSTRRIQAKIPVEETVPLSFRTNTHDLYLFGNTAKSDLIMGFSPTDLSTSKSPCSLPKFAKGLLISASIGYITGGIDDLEANLNVKATIDSQILQGTVSKKLFIVNILSLKSNPSQSINEGSQMLNARYGHCMTWFDGELYVIGGRQYGADDQGLLAACQKYNPNEKKWMILPPLRKARAGAAVAVIHNIIYIFGGYAQGGRSKTVQYLTKNGQGWLDAPFSLPQALQGMTLIKNPINQDSILMFGGKTALQRSNRVYSFKVNRYSISSLQSMTDKRSFIQSVTVGNLIYLIGGSSETIQVYDVANQTAQNLMELSYLQYCTMKQMCAFCSLESPCIIVSNKQAPEPLSFSSKINIIGNAHEAFMKTVDLDNLLVLSEGMSLSSIFDAAVVRANKQFAFVIGGISPDFTQVSSQVYSFNYITQEVKMEESMLISRYGFPACVKGSYLYVIGGRKLGSDEVALLNHCERFSFETYKWEKIAPMKIKRQSAVAVAIPQILIVMGGYKGNGIRWVEIDRKFDLIAEAMYPVTYNGLIYLFGGRTEQNDIQKVFKMKVGYNDAAKYQKAVTIELQPAGSLSNPGTNLKVYVSQSGIAYVFGHVQSGVDFYDIKKQKLIQTVKIPALQKLKNKFFQGYTFIL